MNAGRFRVEFVTYKWPEWLRRQSEKQRIIWGYKILFLDVLFPLHVDKIIYVDADQVCPLCGRQIAGRGLRKRLFVFRWAELLRENSSFFFWFTQCQKIKIC